jgi:GNAT superfamily N-acetyltransferase
MITIRPVQPADASEVKALIEGIMGDEFHAARNLYALHDIDDPGRYYSGKKDIFLVAEKDGHIVGTVAIKEDTPKTALLRRIFVRKNFRGKGYGEKLLARAMEFCFDHHYETVVFRGVDKMQDALKLCLKNGFQETDVDLGQDLKLMILTKNLRADRPSAVQA